MWGVKLIFLCAAIAAVHGEGEGTENIDSQDGQFNIYYLFTRQNGIFPQVLRQSPLSIHNSYFNPWRDTAVIVHGHRGSAYSGLNPSTKDAYLTSYDANVIVVDWGVFAGQSYPNAVDSVPNIGHNIANFLSFLTQFGLNLRRVHLIGFDLGAHVIGFAGRNLGGNVARITGLSPSASRWGSRSGRLCNTDAVYVEVIHTDANAVTGNGISTDIGDVNFHANGGTNQPGCFFNLCDHERSFELFTASLLHNHLIGWRCTGMQNALNTCRGETLHMGNGNLVKTGFRPGQYRVNTNSRFPF